MAAVLSPKRPAWLIATLALALGAIAVYAVWSWWQPWRPGRPGGLVFGTIAALLFLYDGLYPLRRRFLAWPLGTAQRWLQLHIYGGTFALLCVMLHVGFGWPKGTLGWWLLGLAIWTTATGLLGVMLQKWIPVVVAGALRVEALASRIPQITAQLLAEADRIMTGAPAQLWAAYQTEIRPGLVRPAPEWAYVANVQAGMRRYQRSLEALDRAASDRGRMNDLRTIVNQKAELDVHLSLQRALRVWLLLHVPPAMLLLGLLAVHVFAVLYF